MTPAWRLGIGIAAVLSLAAALSLLSEILLPFVAGMAVAYFLDPLADRLEKWRCSRTLATSLITAAFFVISVAIVVLLFRLLQAQVTKFLIRVPEYASRLREFAMPFLERLETDLTAAQMEKLGEAASTYGAQAIGWIAGLLMGLWSGGVAASAAFLIDRHHPAGDVLPAPRLGPHRRPDRRPAATRGRADHSRPVPRDR